MELDHHGAKQFKKECHKSNFKRCRELSKFFDDDYIEETYNSLDQTE